jgi:adenine deaminase
MLLLQQHDRLLDLKGQLSSMPIGSSRAVRQSFNPAILVASEDFIASLVYDLMIRGGMVFDGLRNPRVLADVAIKDGMIVDIGKLDPQESHRVLNADGLNVAPGFVDLHTHYGSQLFWDWRRCATRRIATTLAASLRS